MFEHYKLDDENNPIPCSIREWGEMYRGEESNKRRKVANDLMDDYEISTVFTGYDMGYEDKLLLFETMVFNKGNEIYVERCGTWQEAENMHKKAIQWIKDGCKDEE